MNLLGFLIALYNFFVSIELIAGGFKLFGKGFAHTVMGYTGNPPVSLSAGLLATALVQSSSSTTSLLVGMVAAGTIPIRHAIPVVMGANIGTTITNTLVSLGHISRGKEFERAISAATIHDFFNIMAVLILFPIELVFHPIEYLARGLTDLIGDIGGFKILSPVKAVVKPVVHKLIELLGHYPLPVELLGIVLLFLSLHFLTYFMKRMALSKIEFYIDRFLFKSPVHAFLFGLVLTSIIQSSSVSTSLAVPFAAAGMLSLHQVFPYTLGANVGTTLTAIMAALITHKPEAITVAFSHLWFNILGIVVIYGFLRKVPIKLAQRFSRLVIKNKFMAAGYLIFTFYLLPLLIILFLGRR